MGRDRRNKNKRKDKEKIRLERIYKIAKSVLIDIVNKSIKIGRQKEYNEKDHIVKNGVWFKKPVRSYSRLYQYIYNYRPIDYAGDSD